MALLHTLLGLGIHELFWYLSWGWLKGRLNKEEPHLSFPKVAAHTGGLLFTNSTSQAEPEHGGDGSHGTEHGTEHAPRSAGVARGGGVGGMKAS